MDRKQLILIFGAAWVSAALLVWFASLFGHKVIWRGDAFKLKDGKLVRIGS